jgi:hypothetical protein
VTCFGAVVPLASAGQIDQAKTRVASLSASVLREAELVHTLSVRYRTDAARAAVLRKELSSSKATLRAVKRRYRSTESMLQEEAVISYAGGIPAIDPTERASNQYIADTDRAAYLTVAVGNLSQTLEQFQIDQADLASVMTARKIALHKAMVAKQAADSAWKEALSQAASLQAMLSEARGQVATLSAKATTGPPVGGGVVKAVRQEMQSSTSSTSTTSSVSSGSHPPPAGGVWLELRECESSNNYQEDTGNGFYGAYQFLWATWTAIGYPGRPDEEPYWMQDEAAKQLQAESGWGQWPACSAALGL